MALYEHIFIARQDVSPAQVDLLTEELQDILKEGGGKVEKTEYWGLRNLQYKIKKNRKGHYALMHIDAPSDAVAEMERQMKLKEDILRFMTIRVDELDPEPSPVMSRRDRDERRPPR